MSTYFYTIELSPEDGRTFERLADLGGYEDREEFGGLLLKAAIRLCAERERLDQERLAERIAQPSFIDIGLLPYPEYWPTTDEPPF